KCRTFEPVSEYGTPLGTAKDGSPYNQVINAHFYWYQQEWSNEGARCEQRLEKAPPTITRVSPKRGPSAGGTVVTISGSGFSEAKTVSFGGFSGEILGVSATTIQVKSPAHAKGTVEVSVTTAVGTSAPTRKDHFKYAK
ncbi:MAG TPA: IPT/TIG domain-containing protein, partial [Solirubrobacteraceae bacterium]|nr:IPT/TIG domain-containing protein [Solirubrobacteraceae bacterium]